MLLAVSSGGGKVHANLQPSLSHHVDGTLERLSSVASAHVTGLPTRQLAGPRRTFGTFCGIRSQYSSFTVTGFRKHDLRKSLENIKKVSVLS